MDRFSRFCGSFPSILCVIMCMSYVVQGMRNDVLEVRKQVSTVADHYLIAISYRSVGEAGRVSNIQIIDSLPEGLKLINGDLVAKVKDPNADWNFMSYQASANVNPALFSIENSTLEILLPSAEVSYARTGHSSQRESIYTETTSIKRELVDSVVNKGGSRLSGVSSSVVVAWFALALPVVAAINLINTYQQKALDKSKKSK